MLGDQLEAESVFARYPNFFFYVIAVRSEFIAQLSANIHRLVKILDDPDPSENYDTLDIQRPFALVSVTAVINAEGSFVASPESIDLVPRLAAVKVDMTVFLAVIVIDRNAVRVSVIADLGKHASRLVFQYFFAFLKRDRLLFSYYLSEHFCGLSIY